MELVSDEWLKAMNIIYLTHFQSCNFRWFSTGMSRQHSQAHRETSQYKGLSANYTMC